MKVVEYILAGNSSPIIVEDGTGKYFVKLRAGMSGNYSLLNEWFGNQVGRQIRLNTREASWIKLHSNLEYSSLHIELRDLIEKSKGLNISFKYIENAKELSLAETENLSKKKFCDAYLLDVLMLNIDRTETNLNLIKDNKDQLVISDFESSLFFNDIMSSKALSEDEKILQCLKANPFYQRVTNDKLDSFIDRLDKINFSFLIADLPNEVLTTLNKKEFQEKLDKRKNLKWGLKNLLRRIDNTSMEEEKVKKLRIKRNREKLEKLINTSNNKL